MTIIKTQFREISAVRNPIEDEKVKMTSRSSNISVIDIKEMPTSKKLDKASLMFVYEHTVDYNLQPSGNLGKVKVVGEIFYVDDVKKIKGILDDWKKNKKIDENLLTAIINVGLTDANIEAIYQAHKVGLPSPIPLPRLKSSEAKETKGTSSAG